MADAVMEGRTIRSKDGDEEELRAEPMPAGVSRFIDDDEELEDEELLGESTLKHLGTTKPPKASELEEEVDEELEDEDIEDEDLVEGELTEEDEPAPEAEVDELEDDSDAEAPEDEPAEAEELPEESSEDTDTDDVEEK
jgi:hypothetical protein